MQGFARVELIGNLGRAPELRHTQSGKAVATLSVAVNTGKGDREQTEWVRVIVWEKLAENCNRYLDKGSPVYAEGRWQTNKWKDREGNDRSRVEVVAWKVLFLGTKADNQARDEPPPDSGAGGGGESDDGDIPF